jgi:hypothetical protein
MAPNKAPGVDGIPAGFLQAMGDPLIKALLVLTQACWDWEYSPRIFHQARTVVLKKPRKESYNQAKSWSPIALLNTLSKVMEAATARYLQDLAESHSLLPETQMGARRNRSRESALDLLVSQIRATWAAKGVATLLSLDMFGAFDHVIRDVLIRILLHKGVPRTVVGWIRSFMTDRTTTLVVDGCESERMPVPAGNLQGSPISPILFLFYNSELVEICNPPDLRAHGNGFVDDVNVIAWGPNTKSTCATLEAVHEHCLEWAKRHGAKFAPEKYELLHLTRANRKHQTSRGLKVGAKTVTPGESVRDLGLHIDPKLRWTIHGKHIEQKMLTQENALRRLTASTWGLPLQQARQVYTMVVRPALTYAAHIWPNPVEGRYQRRALLRLACRVHNRCLRLVNGAFRATPTTSLETLAYVPPLDLYLTGRLVAYRRRAAAGG